MSVCFRAAAWCAQDANCLMNMPPHHLSRCCTGPEKHASKRSPGEMQVPRHHLELKLGMAIQGRPSGISNGQQPTGTAQQGGHLWQCGILCCCLLQGKQEQSSREAQRPNAVPHQTRARTAAVSGSAIGVGSRANSDGLINDGAGPSAMQSLGSGLTGASLLGASGQGGEGGSGSHCPSCCGVLLSAAPVHVAAHSTLLCSAGSHWCPADWDMSPASLHAPCCLWSAAQVPEGCTGARSQLRCLPCGMLAGLAL